MLGHAGLPFVSGGYVGVDIFFVISGFLITSHLLTGLESERRVHFATFYARRARRILPASFTVLALSILGAFLWVPPLLREQVLKDAIATAFYVPNYSFAVQGTDYLAESTPSLFQHYWSLGVEEQFYLVWPLLLLVVFLLARSRRARTVALAVLVVVSFAACVFETYRAEPWAFFSLWTRAWELGLGGLVAVLLRWHARMLPPVVAVIVGWLGLVGIALTCVFYSAGTVFPGAAAAVPVVATALVILGGATPARFAPTALLSTRPFQFLGLISYSLYLVHWPILVLAQAGAGYYTPLPLWETTLLAIVAVPVAWLLYRVVENPARTTPWLARARPARSLLGAAIGSAVIAAIAVVAIVGTDALPLNAGKTDTVRAATAPPIGTPYVPSNLKPTLQTAADDNPSIYADGCEVGFSGSAPHPCTFGSASAPKIVLFGDSHAAQWYPALQRIAKADGYQLETQTKSACASVDVELLQSGVPYTSCDQWRATVIAQLRADPPALVVLANYTNPVFARSGDETGQWRTGLEHTIDSLTDVTKVAVIADTPDLRVSPTVCLSAHLTSAADCGRPASIALKSPGRAAEPAAVKATNATLIDLTDYFCTKSECPAIIGDTLAYRDSHHVSATYSAELAGPLGAKITPLMR